MLWPALWLAKGAGVVSRGAGRGGGTTLPGKLLRRLDHNAIAELSGRLERGAAIVSATNGKTTTANMIAGVLGRSGVRLVHNRAGANLQSGVATALLADAGALGRPHGELGLFEVDEAAMPAVAREVRPHTLLLSNLFRDQLDRYGELEHLAELWADLVTELTGATRFLLCADDPLVADLGRTAEGELREGVTYFGVEDESQALPTLSHAADSKHCRRCGAAYAYQAVFLGHLGKYSCPNCGAGRPQPQVAAERVVLRGMSGSELSLRTPAGPLELSLPLPGLYNVYNALAATACCLELGADLEDIKQGLEAFAAAFGRVEVLEIDGRSVSILLIKNPTGANEVLRTLTLEQEPGGLDLFVALNDRIADGRDVSWIWDADFEVLAGHTRQVVCSGTRAEEMALRLKYAGLPEEAITVEGDLARALDRSVAAGNGRPLYALPTYTALLDLHDLVARRGHARRFWE